MFPLTYKFGSENSNVILITTSTIVMIIFFVLYIVPSTLSNTSMTNIAESSTLLKSSMVYSGMGILSLIVSYITSIKIFNKQDL